MAAVAYSEKKYGQLLANTLPSVISSDNEYDRIESIFNKFMDKGENRLSLEEARLFELLANLLENYEAKTLPEVKDASPAETLRFLMEQNDIKQSDLEDIFGSQSTVSKVLSEKREISKAQAKRLAARFHVSLDAFI
ncbi:MAG: helix-turn-helix domain-containing protein [Acidobacteriota bacterium]